MKEAIILAGGFGTRLRDVVADVPKPMAPVGGRPFLTYLLDNLISQGYSRAVLATGYLHEKVEAYFGCRYRDLTIAYSRETSPLGTGGAIAQALQLCETDCVTVLNGDTLFLIDHDAFIAAAAASGCRLAIVTRRVENAGRYGSVESDATSGLITAFREKDPGMGAGYINGGIYRMHRSLLDGYAVGQPFSFEKEILQPLRESILAYPFEKSSAGTPGFFIDIGIPEDYRRAQTELPQL